MPLLLVLALLAAIPAAAQTPIPHLLLPERSVGEPPVATAHVFGFSAAASDGENFVVVSAVDRSLRGFQFFVSLVDGDGNSLLPVSHTFDDFGEVPDVASSGRSFLVVGGGLGGTTGMLLDRSGSIRKGPFTIHESTRTRRSSHDTIGQRSVGWNGGEYVVLTERQFDQGLQVTHDLVVTRVSEDATILQNDVLVANDFLEARIAARNGVSVIVMSNSSGILVRTMSSAGALSTPITISDQRGSVAVAAGDNGFLIVWNTTGSNEAVPGTILAQYLDPAGRPEGAVFTVTTSATNAPAVTWTGRSYEIAWRTLAGDVQVIKADSASTELIIPNARNPALASNGRSTLVVWNANANNVFSKRIDASGPGQPVHSKFVEQSLSALSFLDNRAVVSWADIGGNLREITNDTAPISVNGTVVLLRGFNKPLIITQVNGQYFASYIGGTPFPIPQPNPKWNGNGFLFVWSAQPQGDPFAYVPIYAQRLDADGRPVDEQPRQIATAAYVGPISVGSSASKSLITYRDLSGILHGLLLSGDDVIDVGAIAEPPTIPGFVTIASDGSDFLVTWINNPFGGNDYIAARRISSEGKRLGDWRIYSLGHDVKWNADTFWTGKNYLVVWGRVSETERELWTLRISREGDLIDYPPQRIGTISAGLPILWAYHDGILAIAYTRDLRVYTRLVVPSRQRSIVRR
ncbi:MAG TPA: hypothetical protein VGS96_19055 [Thermoanaerobaculia bacterium]|nr:hypothetical protein [Thermoanaerobaculia bacterium]